MSTLALPYLFDQVIARFGGDAADQTPPVAPVPNLWGSREADTKLVTKSRIAWIPGDPGGNLGALLPPRNPGRNPRSLGTLEELCTVEITGYHPGHTRDEKLHYIAARELFDAWYRAVYLAAHGTFRIVSAAWVVDKRVVTDGACLRVVLAIQAVLADAPQELMPVDTEAHISLALVDAIEVTTIESVATEPAITTPDGDVMIDEHGNIITLGGT